MRNNRRVGKANSPQGQVKKFETQLCFYFYLTNIIKIKFHCNLMSTRMQVHHTNNEIKKPHKEMLLHHLPY